MHKNGLTAEQIAEVTDKNIDDIKVIIAESDENGKACHVHKRGILAESSCKDVRDELLYYCEETEPVKAALLSGE